MTSIDRLYVNHYTVSCIFLSQAFHFQEPLNTKKRILLYVCYSPPEYAKSLQ